MCGFVSRALGINTDGPKLPAPPAGPAADAPTAPVFGADQGTAAALASKRGRSALRIDLASGGLGEGTGLNIPQ